MDIFDFLQQYLRWQGALGLYAVAVLVLLLIALVRAEALANKGWRICAGIMSVISVLFIILSVATPVKAATGQSTIQPPWASQPVAAPTQLQPLPLPPWVAQPTEVAQAPAQPSAAVADWHPWYTHKQTLTLAQFIVAVGKDDSSIFRVRSSELARQLANTGLPAPSDPAALAAWLDPAKNPDIKVVNCTAAILRDNYMSRTNATGDQFDMSWSRSECAAGEKMLTYKGRPIISLWCGNILTPKVKAVAAPVAMPAATCASDQVRITMHGWSMKAIRESFPDLPDKIRSVGRTEMANPTGESAARKYGGQVRLASTDLHYKGGWSVKNGQTVLPANAGSAAFVFSRAQVPQRGSLAFEAVGAPSSANPKIQQFFIGESAWKPDGCTEMNGHFFFED